jgi:chorismate mutase
MLVRMADKIEKIRKQIDRIDLVIITVLAERMSLMPEIAEYKKEHNIPVFQEKREQDIIKRLRNIARDYELNEDFVEEIFLSILNEAKRIQHEIINNKQE